MHGVEQGELVFGEAEELGALGVGRHLLSHLHDGLDHGSGVNDPLLAAVETKTTHSSQSAKNIKKIGNIF